MREKILAWLVPPPLRRLDRWLLLNHPRWWATKVHYVFFYEVIINLLAALLALIFFNPGQLLDFSKNSIWIVIELEVFVFFFWFYCQSLASVEKNYGNTSYRIGLIETIIYVICIGLIAFPALIMLRVGIARVTYLYASEKNVCYGPRVLDFYSSFELAKYDKNKMQKALGLAQNAINAGTVKVNDIQIGETVIKPISKESGVYAFGAKSSPIALYNNGRIIVEDGNATIKIYGGDVKIIHKNIQTETDNIMTIKDGGQVIVITGDEISFDNYDNTKDNWILLEGINGKVMLRGFFTYKVEKKQLFIVEKPTGIELVKGDTSVVVMSLWDSYDGIWHFGDDNGYYFCQSFVDQPKTSPYNYLGLNSIELWHIIFILLAIFSVQILKYGYHWLVLIFSISYGASLIGIAYISSYLGFYITPSNFLLFSFFNTTAQQYVTYLLLMILIILFMIVQLISFSISKTKKFQIFALINFVTFPIMLGALGLGAIEFVFSVKFSDVWYVDTQFINSTSQTIVDGVYWIVFFLIYLFFSPLQKKIMIYLMSIPRE